MMPIDTLTKCNCSRSVHREAHGIFQDRHASQMRTCNTDFLLRTVREMPEIHRRSALFLLRCSLLTHFNSVRLVIASLRHSSQACVGICLFTKAGRRSVRTTSKAKHSEMRPLYEIAAICLPSAALVEQVQQKKLALSLFQVCVHDTACS